MKINKLIIYPFTFRLVLHYKNDDGLNGKPLVISSGSVKSESKRGKSKSGRQQFLVYNGKKVNELSESLALVFGKLRKELISRLNDTIS